MVYTKVEITPQTPENHMKKEGSELLPPKTHEQGIHSTIHRYTLPRLLVCSKVANTLSIHRFT